MRYDSQKIADAIKRAVDAAKPFAESDDGGTCNFDCAYLCVPGMSQKQGRDIQTLAGVTLSLYTYRWHGRILQIIGGRSGQGARQTRMAEAMHRSLKAEGVECGMYYQMD